MPHYKNSKICLYLKTLFLNFESQISDFYSEVLENIQESIKHFSQILSCDALSDLDKIFILSHLISYVIKLIELFGIPAHPGENLGKFD